MPTCSILHQWKRYLLIPSGRVYSTTHSIENRSTSIVIQVRVQIISTNSIDTYHPVSIQQLAKHIHILLWETLPNLCIKAASRKHTVGSLNGSTTPGVYPDCPPGWYAIPSSWKRLPVEGLIKSEPRTSIGRTASAVETQSASVALSLVYTMHQLYWCHQ